MNRCIAKIDLEANGIVGKDNPRFADSMITEINGTIEETQKYYAIGKTFNMGIWYGYVSVWNGYKHVQRCKMREDNLMHVTHVFVLEDCEKTDAFIESLTKRYGFDWKEHFCKEEYEKFCA